MNGDLQIPAEGRIDLHSHLVPGVDDGCRSLDESLCCIRRLVEHGFIGTVCTPHHGPDWFPENTPAEITRAVSELDEQLRELGVEYRIWAGGELRISENTLSWIKDVGVRTLGPGRCVLVDYWGPSWPRFADDVCHYLIGQGYLPVLAHPERMGMPEDELVAVVECLMHMGIRLQGNLNSMSGGEGGEAQRQFRRLLREDRYYLVAMDMHRPNTLESRLEGLALVEAEVGGEGLATLVEERPREILAYGSG